MNNNQMHRNRTHHYRGITIIEVMGIIVFCIMIAFVAFFVLFFRFSSRCGISTRLVCASNLKGIGISMAIYNNDNLGSYPVPAFDETFIGNIDYTVKVGSGQGSVRSPNRIQPSLSGPGGARQLSVTRAYWMLVRSGDVTEQQFICPNSGDKVADYNMSGAYLDIFYDFADRSNVSYGFQVPIGPQQTRAYYGRDNRMIFAADKGPYINSKFPVPPETLVLSTNDQQPRISKTSEVWRAFNSKNHSGEGQNVLFADGHAEFKRTPIVGIQNDNIYTVATDNILPKSRIIGESPWKRSAFPYQSYDPTGKALPTTDSVIFP